MTVIAKVFQSGNSQAVRLPMEFRFNVDEVEIRREGEEVILRPRHRSGAWASLRAAVEIGFSDDFLEAGRDQPPIPDDRLDDLLP